MSRVDLAARIDIVAGVELCMTTEVRIRGDIGRFGGIVNWRATIGSWTCVTLVLLRGGIVTA